MMPPWCGAAHRLTAAPLLCRAACPLGGGHWQRRAVGGSAGRLAAPSDGENDKQSPSVQLPVSLAERFRALRRSQAVIYDMHEEQQLQLDTAARQQQQQLQLPEEKAGYSVQRGRTGVLDVEDVVRVLRDEAAADVCTVTADPRLAYVGWLVVGTGRSQRHLLAMAQTVRRLYKLRCPAGGEYIPRIEGRDGQKSGCSGDWLALDLVNVALHLMLRHVRAAYDVEALWAVGAERDVKTVQHYQQQQQQDQDAMGGFAPLPPPPPDPVDSSLHEERGRAADTQ